MTRQVETHRSRRRRWRPRLDLVVLVIAVLGAVPAFGGASPFSSASSDAAGGASPPAGSSADLPNGAAGGSGGPTPAPAQIATPSRTPPLTETPEPPSGPGATTRVASIPALLDALRDNAVGTIVVANGTYHVSPSNEVRSDSLWIGGDAIADRTRPVTVRAETSGGVTFDGGGGVGYGGLSFEDGAHDQTWDGFVFANMAAEESGIVEIGGYVPRRTPHHLTLRHITITRTCTGNATSAAAPTLDHAFYISSAARVGPHDLLFEDIAVDGRGGLASAFHFDHGDRNSPNASRVVVRRLHVVGTQQAIILWLPVLHVITFDHVDITGALSHAVRFESVGATGIVFSNITSTGSGNQGFFSTLGSHPPGVTFTNDSLR